LDYFLDYYKEDIAKLFPNYNKEVHYDITKFVYCENTPASVMCANKIGEDTVEVFLDYATPSYRDCSAGKYIYESLANEGFKKAILKFGPEGHDKYLKKLGAVKVGDAYEKKL